MKDQLSLFNETLARKRTETLVKMRALLNLSLAENDPDVDREFEDEGTSEDDSQPSLERDTKCKRRAHLALKTAALENWKARNLLA